MHLTLRFLVLSLSLLPVDLSARLSSGRDSIAPLINPNSKNESGIDLHHPNISSNLQEVPYVYETLSNGTVRLTAQNNTGVEIVGDVIREGPLSGEIINEFTVQAGGTFVFVDDDVLPGITYLYVFEYFIAGNPLPVINLDYITPVATMPALGSFNLVAALYDDVYDVLRDGQTIAIENTNIQAEANDDYTGSVVFYLNGKRHHDNTYPFSLFGDVAGDYKNGRLKDGTYVLTAIAYPEKNGKGIPGDTATVSFTVENIYEIAVNLYPNPIRKNSMVQVQGPANSPIVIEILGNDPGNRSIIYQGTLDDTGRLQHSLTSQDLTKGIYILSVRINNRVIQKRVIVE